MKWLVALVLATAPAAANPSAIEKPVFTVSCDLDGWTCYDGFPAISADHMTIANVVLVDNALVTEFVSVASSRVLRREIAFDAGKTQIRTEDRVAKLHRELRGFRSMELVNEDDHVWLYKKGTVTLRISYCDAEDCRARYQVTRRRR